MFRASAPGSLMLLGEYAVLHGGHALVTAIDKRISVTLTPRTDSHIILDSALGSYSTPLSNLEDATPFQFVLATLRHFQQNLEQGCHLQIESEFSSDVGFASSAAVTVATLAVLSEWKKLFFTKMELIQHARQIIRDVQGNGSGADVAACVSGGIVFYSMEPLMAEKIALTHPITVIYSGYKTPTAIAIRQIEENFAPNPELFSIILRAIDGCSVQGFQALKNQDWRAFGKIMNAQQQSMDALGVNTAEMSGIIQLLRNEPGMTAAKISGSGMGDCVIALGECSPDPSRMPTGARQISVNMTSEGVRCEKV